MSELELSPATVASQLDRVNKQIAELAEREVFNKEEVASGRLQDRRETLLAQLVLAVGGTNESSNAPYALGYAKRIVDEIRGLELVKEELERLGQLRERRAQLQARLNGKTQPTRETGAGEGIGVL